jgi:Kelch motif/B-box zinc finger/Zinc finger, C3HC4 type (RING finger)
MECSICSELFNEQANCPRLLRCGHTCCEVCLTRVIEDNQIICPSCRNISFISSVDSLPKNYIVLEFLANSRSSETGVLPKPKVSSECPDHPGEKVIRYCIEDSRPVCADCILSHNGHKLVKLDDPILELRFEAKALLCKVEEMIEVNERKKIDILNRENMTKQNLNRELDRIDGYFLRIFEKLENRKKVLKNKIEEAYSCEDQIKLEIEEVNDFSTQLRNYLDTIKNLNTTIESMSIKELADSQNLSQKITSEKREAHVLYSTSQRLAMIDSSTVLSIKTVFNFKNLEQEINKFGTISSAAELTNPAIYCFGMQNMVLKFNISSQKWTQIPIQETNGYEFKNFASAAPLPNGSILITGGTKSSEVYEFKDCKMIRRCSMMYIRSSHNAVYFNGFVYCIGGYNGSTWHEKCEKISSETFNTLPIANLNYRRCAFSSCITGNYIYVFGGYDGTKYLDNIERFNVFKNKWENLVCTLHRPLQNTGAASYAENKIIIAGGYNEKGTLSAARSLDLETLEWSVMPNMSYTRYLMNKLHFCGGYVYAIGGSAQGQNIEYYSVADNKWISTKPYKDFTEDTMYKWAAVIIQDTETRD